MENKFRGTGVALVTPFLNGEVDYNGLENLIEHCINGGVQHLISLGTTGEAATLSKTEKHKVLEFTVEKTKKRATVVAGFGGNNTKAVCEAIQDFHFEGIDGILSASPAYNKPTQEGIYQHYMAIEAVAPKPIIIYNVPGRTSSNIEASTTLRLANASEKFVAVKEASGNLRQCMEIVQHKPDRFAVLSGDDNLTLPMMAFGVEGVISVVANAYPKMFSDMVNSGLKGDFAMAKKLHFQLLKLVDGLFMENNPGGVKAVLQLLGVCRQELRLPLTPISNQNLEFLQKQVEYLKELEVVAS